MLVENPTQVYLNKKAGHYNLVLKFMTRTLFRSLLFYIHARIVEQKVREHDLNNICITDQSYVYARNKYM
jgi:hypothetical protein